MEEQQILEPGGSGGTPATPQQTPGAPPPPPSPLSGCYLLIVIGEPHSPEHKEIILQRIAKGFLSWDSETSHVDLEKELQALTSQAPEGEEARNGERLIQYATENLVTEVLIHPQVNTLLQCVRNLLSSFTRHRHLIHAGYTFAGNGSWILQDGTFSLADFTDAFVEPEVQRVLKAYENCVTVDVHCSPEGDWATERIAKEPFTRSCKVRVNPDDRLTAGGNPIGNFINYINPFLRPASLEQLLEPSDVVGNIRFSHPTLYVFPGGQGDAALFGINGFNMLVDGGFARKACFWDFARHLDRLDAVLMTRLNNGNVNGMSAVLRRKKQTHVYPQIGHFFCNLQERRHATSPDGDKDRDALLVDLLEEGQEIVLNLRHLQLKPHPCYRDGNHVEPVNLYHKVGHGKLDMYIISPAKDNREVKEFLSKWNANDPKLFGGRKEGASLKDFHFPLQNLVSICALLVWQPANPNDTITRILFPGSTPQHKIFEGLDKLKHLEFLKYPVCTARSISPSASTVGITSRASSKIRSVPAVIDKLLPGEGVKTSKPSEINKQVAKTATIPVTGSQPDVKQTKPATITAPVPPPSKTPSQTKQKVDKLTSKTEPPKMKTETNKSVDSDKISAKTEKATKTVVSETSKARVESRTKAETRTSITKSKVDTKTPRSTERKSQRPPPEKKSESAKSSPTTPKKSVEAKMNGVASKTETAKLTRTSSRSRPSPTATPAKSTKEANNRKVVESKYQHVSRVSSTSRASATKTARKDQQETATTTTKTERKPISRRPKPASPSKASAAGKSPSSPAKSSSAKSTPTPSVKSDKDGVIRKVKGESDKIATDSSAVSTPSTVEPETAALKVKAPEVESVETKVVSESKTEKEEITHEKEMEEEIPKPELQDTVEKTDTITNEILVEEGQPVDKKADIQEEPKEETLPKETKDIEKSPSVETEQEGGEEDETEDKESEVVGEEILHEKDIVQEKEDIEATEEEKTEDIAEEETEEPEEQQIEIKKSLADELELEAKQDRKPEEEDEEDEEDEYLIIEKEEVEQYMEDSLQEQESVESHMPEEPDKIIQGPDDEEEEDEGELQKHLRDEVESEKEKKHEAEKDVVKVNGFLDDTKGTDEEDTEQVKEGKSSPAEGDKVSDTLPHDEKDEKAQEKEKEAEKQEKLKTEEIASTPIPDKMEVQEEPSISKEMTPETKEQLQEEVQEIITSAKEIVKTKRESETKFEELGEGGLLEQKDVPEEEKKDTEEGDEVKEASSISPEEKLDISSEKNREITDDTRDTDQKLEEEEGTGIKAADQRYPAEESQPDERFSTTVESAATTAPTLPEDERIPLDEIKEIVEEKYVKEETKEEKPIIPVSATPPRLEQPTTLPQVVVAAGTGIFDPTAPHTIVHLQRDIVKTPDEVADLPVHEEVDPGTYESDEFSRDFKSKDDSSKKQQEPEDARGQSPELDMKADLPLKYDIPPGIQEQLDDSKVVKDEAQLPIVQKEEKTKETIETELEKKTEKLEQEGDKVDVAKDEDKTEKLETKYTSETKETLVPKDDKEYPAHEIPETEDTEQETAKPPTSDKDEKTEEAQLVPEGEKKQVPEEKVEISKPETEPQEKTEMLAELKEVSKTESEKVISDDKEGISEKELPKVLLDKAETLHLEKEKMDESSEKEIADEKDDKKFEADAELLKSDIPVEDALEKLVDSKEMRESEKQTENEKERTVVDSSKTEDISEMKPSPETSQIQEIKPDKQNDIKQITEQFIEMESHVDEGEILTTDKPDIKPSVAEAPEETELDNIEKEDATLEKTDQEKPVPHVLDEKQKEPTVETSEKEKFELEVMELQKSGKEQVNTEESDEKPGLLTDSKLDKTDMGYSEGLSAGVQDLDAKKEQEEKPEPQKSDEEKVLHEDEKSLPQKTEEKADQPQYEDEKLEKEEKESEKMDKEKITEDDKFETIKKSMSDLRDEPETHAIAEKPETVVHGVEDKSSEMKEEAKPKEEEEVAAKDTKEFPALKESITSKEEKEIDEKDKFCEEHPLKIDSDVSTVDTEAKTGDIDTALPSSETPEETEKLGIEETQEEKASPGALSMTYLEIIDKLQKESQKEDDEKDDSKDDSKDEQSLPSVKDQLMMTDLKTKEDTAVQEEPSSLKPTEESQGILESTTIADISTTADKKTKDDDVHKTDKMEELGKDEPGKLQDSKVHTEVEKAEETQKPEPFSETSAEKSPEKDIETKIDLKAVPSPDHLAQMDETKSKLESDLKETEHTTDEAKVSRPTNLDETGLQADFKLPDERDDSYGDESISPGEAYVDSGLEEEPVYGKLEAPEVPEYVTVTPDSAPASPKIQRDQTASHKSKEDMTKQETSEKESDLDKDKTKEKTLIVEDVSHKPPEAAKEEPSSDTLPATDTISDAVDKTPKQIDKKEITDKIDTSITDTSISTKERPDISRNGKEFGEASILDDLVSAGKSAITDIQSKLTTQVEEILTAPQKDQELKTQTGKEEQTSICDSSDKDLTDYLQEVKHGVPDLTAQISEQEIHSRLAEDIPQELVKKEDSKMDVSTEGESVIETHDETLEESKEEKPITKLYQEEEKKPTTTDDKLETEVHVKSSDIKMPSAEDEPVTEFHEKSAVKVDERTEKKPTATEDKMETELLAESLEKKITSTEDKAELHDERPEEKILEDKLTTELHEKSITKTDDDVEKKSIVTEDKLEEELHSETPDKKISSTEAKDVTKLHDEITEKVSEDMPKAELPDETSDKTVKTTDVKETLEEKIFTTEEKVPTELHDDSVEKKKDEPISQTYDASLVTDETPVTDLHTEEPEKKTFTTEEKVFTEIQEKDQERKDILTEDKPLIGVPSGLGPIRETHITYTTTTEEKVSHGSDDITISKSTAVKTESSTSDSSLDQMPTTSFDMVTSKTDISIAPIEKEGDSEDMTEPTTVTATKETTVVTDITKTTTISDSSCMSTSTISEIMSATAIAEKESSAILTSTIATVTSAEREKDAVENGTSGTVHRMMVTASSEDGGTETELCPSPTPAFHDDRELPGTSTSSSLPSSMLTSSKETEEEMKKLTKESISKEDISKTIITSALGATNGDMHMDEDDDIDEGGESGSDGEFGKSKQSTTKTTKTTTTVTRKVLELDDDDLEPDGKENYEEVTTQEIGEDGRIITRTVKTTRTFVTVTQEGEDSEDSDFEDEDNIESTAAEDGSDSSRISKTTTSFTTVTKPDDNGVRSLSTDSSDKTGDADSEVISKTTTTTVTVSKTVTGDESDDILTTTTTTKQLTLGDGRVIESTSSSQEVGKSEDDSRVSSADSIQQAELPTGSSDKTGDLDSEVIKRTTTTTVTDSSDKTIDLDSEGIKRTTITTVTASSDKTGDLDSEVIKRTTTTTITGSSDKTIDLDSEGVKRTTTTTITDSSDKIGDLDSEVIKRTTTTTVTVSKSVTGDEPEEISTTTTTTKQVTLDDGRMIESTSSSHEFGKNDDSSITKDDDSRLGADDSTKQAELSKDSSPLKSVVSSSASDSSAASEKDMKTKVEEMKVDDKKLLNGNEYDKEAHEIMSKSVMGELDDMSSTSLLQTSTKKEADLRTATPGSDGMSDRELDIGCGPSTPHSDISSGQVSRAATNVWGSHEGRPDSRHCDSDEDDDEDEPGSPLSVTSQLAHSPPSHFDFEMGDKNTSDFDIKHSITTSVKHKDGTTEQSQFTSSSMTSSFYGSLPPDPLQELLQEQKDKDSHKSSEFRSEIEDKYGAPMKLKDSAMSSSFYGSLEEKKGTHHPEPIGAERYAGHLQEDEPLDFETAMYEHRTTRGKDLTPSSSSYHYETSGHVSKYEHLYTPGLNGQKQKDEHSYPEISDDYGNGNIASGKQFEDLMNQNREARGDKINGKGAGFGDPIDSGFHSETFSKGSTSDAPKIGVEHDPMFHHQFAAPTTSVSSFPEAPQGFAQPSIGKIDDKKKDPIADWGKPLGLPAPAPPPTNNSDEVLPQNTNKGTPKKEKKVMQMKKTMMMNENNKASSGGQTGKDSKSKRPESPIKQPSSERKGSSNKEGNRNLSSGKSLGSPIYIDLTYVPHHGNSYYTTLEFFKKVRARYYVFSGTEPSREVYNALLDAKQTWEDKELEVTIIPTYDTDTLGYWVAENEDTLAKYKIDLSPSASRCTINLQDHETSCSAYRLEF